MSTPEWNPLVSSGLYERVFVSELEPGMVNAFDQVVEHVLRVTDERTSVVYADGESVHYGRASSTLLVKSTP